MTKTEQEMWNSIEARGFWQVNGKRAYNMVKNLKNAGKLEGYYVYLGCHNANGVEFRSQWNSPRILLAYEVVVRKLD